MKMSKVLLIVLVLAAVSAILTLYSRNDMSMMIGRDSMMLEEESMMMAEPGFGTQTSKMDIGIGYYPEPLPPVYYGDDSLDVSERSYRSSSNHQVIVDDVSSYINEMRDYITSIEGRVLSISVNSSEDYYSGYLYAKVPVDQFDQTNNKAVEGVEEIVSQNINTDDITGQVISAQEALQKLNDQLDLLEAQLAEAQERGDSAVVILKIQQNIDRIKSQIDAAENRDDAVQQQVEYSDVTISAADSARFFRGYDYKPSLWDEVKDAFRSLKGSLRTLTGFAAWVVVYSVIWLPIVWMAKWLMSKFKKN